MVCQHNATVSTHRISIGEVAPSNLANAPWATTWSTLWMERGTDGAWARARDATPPYPGRSRRMQTKAARSCKLHNHSTGTILRRVGFRLAYGTWGFGVSGIGLAACELERATRTLRGDALVRIARFTRPASTRPTHRLAPSGFEPTGCSEHPHIGPSLALDFLK